MRVAIFGGTGADQILPTDDVSSRRIATPFGEPSSEILEWQSGGTDFSFIARHGRGGAIPPHLVNYRANLWAAQETRPDCTIGINAVGGIAEEAWPTRLVFPDQIIDYTWGREHTYADAGDRRVDHVDFTAPFSAPLRSTLVEHARSLGIDSMNEATYGVTQGPRLESAAEVNRLDRDGCHIVGMTAMPEAGLARELNLNYVICAVVVNWAAGRGQSGQGIHEEIHRYLVEGMQQVNRLLDSL